MTKVGEKKQEIPTCHRTLGHAQLQCLGSGCSLWRTSAEIACGGNLENLEAVEEMTPSTTGRCGDLPPGRLWRDTNIYTENDERLAAYVNRYGTTTPGAVRPPPWLQKTPIDQFGQHQGSWVTGGWARHMQAAPPDDEK